MRRAVPEGVRVAAAQATRRLVRDGVVRLEPACEHCGKRGRLPMAYGGPRGPRRAALAVHHRDYDNPADVMVLCHSCHRGVHSGKIPRVGPTGRVGILRPPPHKTPAADIAAAHITDLLASTSTFTVRDAFLASRASWTTTERAIRALIDAGIVVRLRKGRPRYPAVYAPGPAYHAAPSEAA